MTLLSSLPNATLFRQLATLVTVHRSCTADIVEHLAEIDARRAYVEYGYPTLFRYCEERLHFSEDEAGRRIEAARLLRRFPDIAPLLRSGALSLSVLCALKAHVTPENYGELLAGVSNMSRRKADEWLAARFPKPDLREAVRQLPTPVRPTMSPPIETDSLRSPPTPSQTTTLAPPAPLFEAPPSPPRIEPRSEDRFAIRLTVSRRVKEQLELAVDLLRHSNPTGALEAVIEAAVAALLERLKIKKLGATRGRRISKAKRAAKEPGNERTAREEVKATDEVSAHDKASKRSKRTVQPSASQRTARPSASQRTAQASASQRTAQPSASQRTAQPGASDRSPRTVRPGPAASASAIAGPSVCRDGSKGRRIGNATRRAVVARDGIGCSYVGLDGKRCGSCAFLEFDHRDPAGVGGTNDAGNLRLLCRAHNQSEAERVYGKPFMQRARSRAATAPARTAPRSGPATDQLTGT